MMSRLAVSANLAASILALAGAASCGVETVPDQPSLAAEEQALRPPCGDGVCSTSWGESWQTCPEDCEPPSCDTCSPSTTTSYTYRYECRLDGSWTVNQLWRIEYRVVQSYWACCGQSTLEETEIYAYNTGNTSSCPQ